jgi:DNA-binding phage protein
MRRDQPLTVQQAREILMRFGAPLDRLTLVLREGHQHSQQAQLMTPRHDASRPQRMEIAEFAPAEIAGEGQLVPAIIIDDERGDTPQLEGIRQAILGLQSEPEEHRETPTLPQLEAGILQAHALYQRANYDAAADLLPLIIRHIEAPANVNVPPQSKAATYLAVAKLATKMGQNSLSWVAADRGLRVASETGQPGLIGIANYQVACALLGSGHVTDAEQIAALAAEYIDSGESSVRSVMEDVISAQGALFLLLAVIAARRGNRQIAKNNLLSAGKLAERLGQDGNWLWTGFGPTNIAIHELAVQVALGDSGTALQFGQRIDTDALPVVLRGRRSQVHLELAWASVGQGDDSLAVLHLLEAERIAEQAVSRNAKARALLTTLMSRERKGATPGLRALASRAEVI